MPTLARSPRNVRLKLLKLLPLGDLRQVSGVKDWEVDRDQLMRWTADERWNEATEEVILRYIAAMIKRARG